MVHMYDRLIPKQLKELYISRLIEIRKMSSFFKPYFKHIKYSLHMEDFVRRHHNDELVFQMNNLLPVLSLIRLLPALSGAPWSHLKNKIFSTIFSLASDILAVSENIM